MWIEVAIYVVIFLAFLSFMFFGGGFFKRATKESLSVQNNAVEQQKYAIERQDYAIELQEKNHVILSEMLEILKKDARHE